MKMEITEIKIKYFNKVMLSYCASLFLATAFKEALEKNESLEKALSQFREAMPESLKEAGSDYERDYARYFYNLQFVELVSNIELFMIEVLTLVISIHPKKIGKHQVSISDVIELNSSSRVVEKACAEYLNDLTYKKPSDYKDTFLDLLSAKPNLIDDSWPKFIEMKARRDLGVHNDWEINEIYKRKVKEIGITVPNEARYMYPTEEYFLECIEIAQSFYKNICAHVEEKYSLG